MATIEECRSALDQLSANMAKAEGGVRDAAALDRSLSCRITDLDVTFAGRLADGRIQDVVTVPGEPPEKAQIRLAMSGDDLVALVGGGLNFAKAWGSGRVTVRAGLRTCCGCARSCDLGRFRAGFPLRGRGSPRRPVRGPAGGRHHERRTGLRGPRRPRTGRRRPATPSRP